MPTYQIRNELQSRFIIIIEGGSWVDYLDSRYQWVAGKIVNEILKCKLESIIKSFEIYKFCDSDQLEVICQRNKAVGTYGS